MVKFEFENEIYYFHNNNFYDSHYIEVDRNTKDKISKDFFNNIDYEKMDAENLLNHIKALKDCGLYFQTIKICKYGIKKFIYTSKFIKSILPIYTSSLRGISQPHDAIDLALIFINNPRYNSIALFTSIAAAFCDIKDYVSARKYINRAYAMQGGSVNEINEISLVYKRINAEQ